MQRNSLTAKHQRDSGRLMAKLAHQRRGAADRGQYCEAAGTGAQLKKAPTQIPGPSDYQQKITLKTFVSGSGSLTTAR